MVRLLLCLAVLCVFNCTVQAQIYNDNYVTRNGGFQPGMALKYQMTDNILYNAHNRFTVTSSATSGVNISAAFFPTPSPPHRCM